MKHLLLLAFVCLGISRAFSADGDPVITVPSPQPSNATDPFEAFLQTDGVDSVHSYFEPKGVLADHCTSFNQQICADVKKDTHSLPDFKSFLLIKAVIQRESRYDPQAWYFENHDFRNQSWVRPLWDQFLESTASDDPAYTPAPPSSGGSVIVFYLPPSSKKLPDDQAIKYFETSYGLMQILYSVAQGTYSFTGKPRELHDDPNLALDYGIQHLLSKLDKTRKMQSDSGTAVPGYTAEELAAIAYHLGSIPLDSNGRLLSPDGERYVHENDKNGMGISELMDELQNICGFKDDGKYCSEEGK